MVIVFGRTASNSAGDAADAGGDAEVLWRALPVARLVLLGYALVVNAWQFDDYAHQVWAVLVLAVLVSWTAAAPWLYAMPAWRSTLIGIEFGLAMGALLLTRWIQGPDVAADGPSVPSFWIAAPLLAVAIRGGAIAGLAAAVLLGGVDLAIREERTLTTASNVFLMAIAGLVVGYASGLIRVSTRERAAAAAERAVRAERDRLSRAVHDGVLQVLAYIQRRGTEIGGATGELARVAGEQEVELRRLVQGRESPAQQRAGTVDLVDLVHRHATGASVATPPGPVLVAAERGGELVAAMAAALDNSARHAPGAHTYVLLEVDGEEITVSVGDDGPGIAEGRLARAAAEGRLGVAGSIRARLAELDGCAELRTAPGQGTEWELRMPTESAGAR